MFGLCGTHRSGKTTLAKDLAEAMKIPYIDASTTAIMSEIGFNPVGPTAPIQERIEAQEYLLDGYLKLIEKAPRPFIIDRVPLDMAGYMLAEITMHNSTQEQGERVQNYVNRCVFETRTRFGAVLCVRPLHVYEKVDKSPPPNPAYQSEVSFLIEGIMSTLSSDPALISGVMNTQDRASRIKHAKAFFEVVIEDEMRMRKVCGSH
jgi:hypothetical protein